MSEWISVQDRLPEHLQRVLCLNTNGIGKDARGRGQAQASYAIGSMFHTKIQANLREITHWMPLPAPPTQTGKGE